MSAVSLLEISKWNEETKNQVEFTKPELVDYFTSNFKLNKLSQDIDSLKYFDNEVKLNVFSMKLKFENDFSKDIPVKDELSLPVEKWMQDNCSNEYFQDVEIVTFPSVISTIMNTPFEITGDKRKWKINAIFESNKIFLIPVKPPRSYKCEYWGFEVTRGCFSDLSIDDDHSVCKSYRVTTPDLSKLPKNYELFKRYLFVRKPESTHRKIISKWDKLFYEVYKLNVGDNSVLYLSETPGVSSEQKLNSVEELKTAEHIYCGVSELGEFTQEVINYNPEWWSRAQLINAKQCYICMCNGVKNDLEEIINFKTDKFNDTAKYENLWSSKAAWNFLNDVLLFIKDEVYKIDAEFRSECLWEFRSFENDRPYVTVIPYGPNQGTVPDTYVN